MKLSKLITKLLREENVVAVSLTSRRVYLSEPAVKELAAGYEYVVIGKVRPFFLYPVGCSPHFKAEEGYATAQHCIGISKKRGDRVVLNDGTVATVLTANPWKHVSPLLMCLGYVPVNRDVAYLDVGNDHDENPVAVLSGGTVPPGYTFFEPIAAEPIKLIGKKLCGISLDYDAQQFFRGEWKVVDYTLTKYLVKNKIYLFKQLLSAGYSKPGFSGTNAYVC